MGRYGILTLTIISLVVAQFVAGCVERRLTINTEPQGAIVVLNDEEIGTSPATVSFEWYGDYNVAIRKLGFETLKTHRKLKAPWYDAFPFDFFAQLIVPDRIIDSYEWTFELEEKRQIGREELLQNARQLKEQLE
ncbi:MAG: PEGA domain-containing protein [Planctomycetota bacterium]|jgi:hypothetical protein